MKNIQTPAYILKKEVLENSILSFEKALSSFFPRYILSYSLKTNSFPYILKTIRRFGGYAEVVSYDEYELAKLCGFAINEIVYNGPLKSKETFLEAIQGGAIVNIETKKELLWLKELPKDKKFGIGLRINIDLAEISSKDAKKDEDFSRFGFSEGSGELKFAIEQICELPNIILEGMHVHRTTASRSLEAYKGIAKFVGGIINKYNLSVAYIDMGGGYYGIMDNKPNFHEYCEIMYEGLRTTIDIDKITLVVEPGNAIVASAFDFVSEVIDVKKVRDFYIATTDGSRNDLDPFYKKSDYFKDFLLMGEKSRFNVVKQIVTGGTCLEYDKLFELMEEPLLEVGDRIVYKSVGAYTMTLAPLFIRFFPNVYLEEKEQYSLIRQKWSARDFFEIYDEKQ